MHSHGATKQTLSRILSNTSFPSPSASSPLQPLPNLLPPSLNPRHAVVDLVSSHLTAGSNTVDLNTPTNSFLLLHYLGPNELTTILLRTAPSHPLQSFRFVVSPHLPVLPTPLHFSLLAHSLAASRLFSHSLSAVSHLVARHPDADHFDSLLAASRLSNPHHAVFSLLVKLLARSGHLDAAIRACRRAVDAGYAPDAHAFNSLLSALSDAARFADCWALYAGMARAGARPNAYTFNIMVGALCRGEDAARAREFLEEIEEQGFVPDVVTYNTLLGGCCKKGRVEDAMHLFEVMPRRGVEPDLVSHTVLIGGLCRVGRLVEARRVFDGMLQRGLSPDAFAYNVIIAGYCKEGRVREARLLLLEMVAGGLTSDSFACRVVVEGHVRAGKLITCLNLVSQLRQHRMAIPLESYSCLVSALCVEKRPNAARGLLLWMIEDGYNPSLEMYNVVVECFCQCDCVREAFDVKDEMYQREIRPDMHMYRSLISCLCSLGRSSEGESLMAEMIESGLQPDATFCAELIGGCCKEGALERAESILRHFVLKFQVRCNASYNALMRAYCEEGNMAASLDLQERMLELGFVPSSETCRSLIYGLSRSIT